VWLAVWRWILGSPDALACVDDDQVAEESAAAAAAAAPTTAALVESLGATHQRVPCLANHECVGLAVAADRIDSTTASAAKRPRVVGDSALEDSEVAGVLAAFALSDSAEGRQLLVDVVAGGGASCIANAAARRATDALALLHPRLVDPLLVDSMQGVFSKGGSSIARVHAAYVLGEWASAPTDETRQTLLKVAMPALMAALRPDSEGAGRVRESAVSALGIHGTLVGADATCVFDAVLSMLESESLLPAQPAMALALLYVQRAAPPRDDAFKRCVALLSSRKDRYAGSLLLELLQRCVSRACVTGKSCASGSSSMGPL